MCGPSVLVRDIFRLVDERIRRGEMGLEGRMPGLVFLGKFDGIGSRLVGKGLRTLRVGKLERKRFSAFAFIEST
jgi:hypothetical protein